MKRKQSIYTIGACEKLMNQYCEKRGYVETLEEGVLGLGLVICYGEGLKTTVIREIYLNAWESGHTIRMYKKMPKKYEAMIEGR